MNNDVVCNLYHLHSWFLWGSQGILRSQEKSGEN